MALVDYAASRTAPTGASYDAHPGEADVERVRAFWRRVDRYPAGAQVGVGMEPERGRRLVVVSGWACELRILPDGRRQIFGFLLPTDTIDTSLTQDIGTRGVVALTPLQVVNAPDQAIEELRGPDALVRDAYRRQERLYDHMVRMGRLTARERVLHLLLELCERLDAVGLVRGDTFKIPLTQELFADTLGLSVVHINRTLKQLREEGWISLKSGSVTLHRRTRHAAACCYRSGEDGAAATGAPAPRQQRG